MKSNLKDQLDFGFWNQSGSTIDTFSETLPMQDAEITFYPSFFHKEESDNIFRELYHSTNWRQDKIKYYGKEIDLPRLTAWYGDVGKSYKYSHILMEPESWTPTLLYIKSKIEVVAKVSFNSVLLNLYRSGRDGVSWHSDDEPELGENPIVGSVSFGEARPFQFKHRLRTDLNKVDILLTHGSFLLMKGATQRFWKHQIPKTSKSIKHRVNLTFRVIY